MSDHKPEWYARLRKGPFEKAIFDSKMQQEMESHTKAEWSKSPKRRLNPWAAAVVAAVFLFIAIALVPAASQPFGSFRQSGGNADEPVMPIQYVLDHLQVGMSEEGVKQAFGDDFDGQGVRRDFAQGHKEDPNDMSTWSAVDTWRYDFGVNDGYVIAQNSGDTDEEAIFDLQGIRNGKIESQLVVYWKDRKVERAIFKDMDIEGNILTTQIGPGVEEAPPTEPPANDDPSGNPEMPPPNEGVRAVGDTSFGLFQLRPAKGGDEKIQALGAPSCLGQENDLQYSGDYELYFHKRSGDETLIQEFNQLEMIQRENNTIEFMKLEFPKLELYLFIPRYTDCHGLEFYAYGIDKETGEVSNFTFLNGEETYPNWTTSPNNLPQAVEGKLVVEGGRGAGQDGATRYVYDPDLATHQLVLESKEQIP
ncbi:hypothetical protein [Cohnella luojiensis]|uniref:Uncharacterized protein n=1 Tax=Cohnella luojiensis TaxID=652876 RepID=A0A4Y8LSP1_9BACL|nr:hypothetical protein [Cohnella luojiensis]TFE24509.1 hypothetical protein E2980_15765 [Cohnella luojiensis]